MQLFTISSIFSHCMQSEMVTNAFNHTKYSLIFCGIWCRLSLGIEPLHTLFQCTLCFFFVSFLRALTILLDLRKLVSVPDSCYEASGKSFFIYYFITSVFYFSKSKQCTIEMCLTVINGFQ